MLRLVLLCGGLALLVLLLWQLGPLDVLDALRRIGWSFVPVFLLGGGHHATRALALRECVVRTGVLRFSEALAIRLSGEAVQSLTFIGPVLSEPTKAWLLERQGLSLKEGFAATITEYLICSFVTAAMSIAGLLYLIARFTPPFAVSALAFGIVGLFSAFLIASAVAIVRRFYLIGTIIAGLAKLGVLRGRLRPDMTWINRMEDLLLIVLCDSPARFATITIVEVGAQALLVLELFCLMQALDVMTPVSFAFVIEASVKVIGIAFLFVPMQVGVSEGAYAVVFNAMGLSAAAGFALAFLRRARTLAVAGIGLWTLAVLTRHRERSLT
jgi:Lysylphosphatidylglycerol synthase TM region